MVFVPSAGESGCSSLTTTTSAVAASSSLTTGTPPTVLALADTTADGIVFKISFQLHVRAKRFFFSLSLYIFINFLDVAHP